MRLSFIFLFTIAGRLSALGGKLSNWITTTQPQRDVTSAPKAYINVLFFDEQFRFIAPNAFTPSGEGTDFKRVSSANDPNAFFTPLSQKAPKNGYVFVYLSNESTEPVYFDDFHVEQEHNRIAEESHYYPFGLKIAGISSKAFNKLDANRGYQGEYAEEEEETGWNEFDLRSYDPQIGRWTSADPYDEFSSPYVGMGGDPVNSIDPDGGSILNIFNSAVLNHFADMVGGALIGGIIGGIADGKDGALKGMAYGAGAGLVGGLGTYVPWDEVGSALADAGNWMWNTLNNRNIITVVGKLFPEQTEGYNYMWKNSFGDSKNPREEFKENAGYFTGKGLLVLPNYRNNYNTSKMDVLEVRENKKGNYTHVRFEKKWYSIKGMVHTHPHASSSAKDGGIRVPSGDDYDFHRTRIPGKPAFVISRVETYQYWTKGSQNILQFVAPTKDVLSGRVKLISFK